MNRKKNIDILKVIGLLCIILAHVVNNEIIFQLRNFDVVLMIIISAYLYMCKNTKKSKFDLKYLFKRAKRLLIPTWIFLIIYFIAFSGIIDYNKKTIICSFLLHNGIGYVWIIRIYLIVAIILPLIFPKLKEKPYHLGGAFILIYFLYELVVKYLIGKRCNN